MSHFISFSYKILFRLLSRGDVRRWALLVWPVGIVRVMRPVGIIGVIRPIGIMMRWIGRAKLRWILVRWNPLVRWSVTWPLIGWLLIGPFRRRSVGIVGIPVGGVWVPIRVLIPMRHLLQFHNLQRLLGSNSAISYSLTTFLSFIPCQSSLRK